MDRNLLYKMKYCDSEIYEKHNITILDKEIRPKLIDWQILNFNIDEMRIHLNFTNVIFVSSDE